ncbi:TAXI family TRAP transporter solute-binding subunit [Aquicoccus sp. SCR17]|nr:TAXI family TRAP transporter solute-binding subunit [Carideicomes alvinocaridis]
MISKTTRAVLAAGFVATMGVSAQAQDSANMLTAPTGSMVNTVGTAIASQVSQDGKVDMGTSAMGGPQITVPRTNATPGSFTLLNAADAHDAFNKGGSYQAANTDLRLVSIGFQNPLGILVHDDSGIETAEDIRGKRVTGAFSAHKTCETLATAQLQNLGLSWEDVTVVPVTHSKTGVEALADGRADVAMCVPVGQAIVKQINATDAVRFISMNKGKDEAAKVRELFPAGAFKDYAAGSSEGVINDVSVWNYPFYLVTNKDTPDNVVYEVTRVIHDQIDDLRSTSAVFKSWEADGMAAEDVNVPYHPGAIKFYKEKDMWSDAKQKASDAVASAD